MGKSVLVTLLTVVVLVMVFSLTACGTKTTTTTAIGPGGGAVINSESIIVATIKAVHKETTGYPWSVDIVVKTSQDVGTLPNPVKDKLGIVINVKTDVDMSGFQAGDNIMAHVKYVGDVPKPGISLYLFDITKQ